MKIWQKLLIVFGIVVAVVLLIVFAISSLGKTTDNYVFSSPSKDYLARISVVGEIGDFDDAYTSSDASYHHDWTLNRVDKLIKDTYNKGIILYVNSPGGGVYESDELYLKLSEYQEKTKRPVFVYMGSMAASGGYYISAGATKIYANRNTWTGSIGVIIGTLFDVSEFLTKYGVKATDITSGVNKGMGGYYEPMTPEQRAIFQGLVDEAYEQFVGVVADGRGKDVESIKAISDGRIYTAKQAVENGLIDEIATESDAYAKMKEAVGNANIYVQNQYYTPSTNLLGSLIGAFDTPAKFGDNGNIPSAGGTNTVTQGDIAKVLELAESGDRTPIKYMYGG
jgi:protease-4